MSSPIAEHAYSPAAGGGVDPARRSGNLDRWRRHSTLIHFLRGALPTLIVALLLLLIGWAGFNTLVSRSGSGAAANMSIRMINPKFFGRDEGNKPFILSAASAARDDNQFQKIYLDKPVIIMGGVPTDQSQVTAQKGVYREDSRILILEGDVHLRDASGDNFFSQHALVNTITNDIDGAAHIDGHGPLGQIASSSYAVRNGGEHVFFRGQVKARIEQGAAASATAVAPKAPPSVPLRGAR